MSEMMEDIKDESKNPPKSRPQWQLNKNEKTICSLCNKLISKNGIVDHIRRHKSVYGEDKVNEALELRRINIQNKTFEAPMKPCLIASTSSVDTNKKRYFCIMPKAMIDSGRITKVDPPVQNPNSAIKSHIVSQRGEYEFPMSSEQAIYYGNVSDNITVKEIKAVATYDEWELMTQNANSTIKNFSDLLEPDERYWNWDLCYPWGLEQPTFGMWRYLRMLRNELSDYYRKVNLLEKDLEILSASKNHSEAVKNMLENKLNGRNADLDMYERFFAEILTKDQGWAVLQMAINKIHSLHKATDPTPKWMDEAKAEFAKYSVPNEANYWKYMYSKAIITDDRQSFKYMANVTENNKLKEEMKKLREKLQILDEKINLDPNSQANNLIRLEETHNNDLKQIEELKENILKLEDKLSNRRLKIKSLREIIAKNKIISHKSKKKLKKKISRLESMLDDI